MKLFLLNYLKKIICKIHFTYCLLIFLNLIIFTLVGCNPAKTKLGEDFNAGLNTSLEKSTLSISNSQVIINSSIEISVNLKDQNGSTFITKNSLVTFSQSGGTSVGKFGIVKNNGDGTFTTTFTGMVVGSATTIHAQVDGNEIKNATFNTIKVIPDFLVSLSQSIFSINSPSIISNNIAILTVILKDNLGNQIPDASKAGSIAVTILATGTSTGTVSSFVPTNGNPGAYEATFTALTAGTVNTMKASYSGSDLTSTKPSFTVTFGAATKLSFIQGPTNAIASAVISPSISVRALDINNNLVSTYATAINMAIAINPNGGTLSGTLSRNPVSGIATFNDLKINFYGTAYKLVASSATLIAASSSSFDITTLVLSYDLPFTSITNPEYTTLYTSSSWSQMEFVGNLVQLKPTVQTDAALSNGTMGAGSGNGVVMGTLIDGSQGLKLGNGGSCNGITQDCAKQTATEIYELHSSWTPQWSNLVAYWKMNEVASSGIVEDSVGSNDGIPFNVNQGNPGVLKHSGNFNGVSSYITTGNTATLELGNSLSVSAWINPTSSVKTGAYNPRILLKMDDANNGYMLSLGNSDFSKPLAVHFDLKKAGTQYAPTTSAIISTGVWTHVFCTWDGVTANIYLNGVLETSISETNEFTYGNVSDLILGARLKSGSGMFKGSMDEIAIWNTALTSTEINILYERQKNNYSGTFTSRIMSAENNSRWTNLNWVPTLAFYKELPDYASGANQYEIISGPNGYPSLNDNNLPNNLMDGIEGLWHLNEVLGTSGAGSIKDNSGKENNGTPIDMILGQSGKLSRGAYFDGNGSIKVSTPSSGLNPGSTNILSAVAWVKRANVSSTGQIMGIRASGGWTLNIGNGGSGTNIIKATKYGVEDIYLSSYPTDTNWHHLAVTWSNSGVDLYIDGTFLDHSTDTQNFKTAKNGLFYLGGGTDKFHGFIDEAAVWSRALSDLEIKQLYQRGASRLKYQVKSCEPTDPVCNVATWKGPDGTSSSFFSELNNLDVNGKVRSTLPSLLFSNFTSPPLNNPYFQYLTIFESDTATTSLMPELKSVTIDPIHYNANSPFIYSNIGVEFSELNTFAESLGTGGCSSGIGYNLSVDKLNWYWWDSSKAAGCVGLGNGAWCAADATVTKSNVATVIHNNTLTFGNQVGRGTVYVKAYLKSDGESKCELDNIHFGGKR